MKQKKILNLIITKAQLIMANLLLIYTNCKYIIYYNHYNTYQIITRNDKIIT